MIINISIDDHRFDIRHWAQNPQLHVGPFHNFIRFLNAVNTLHCLISLSSVFRKTGDKYDRRFFQQDSTRFNKIATQGTPQMAVDKEANSLSRVYSYYSKFNLRLFYV